MDIQQRKRILRAEMRIRRDAISPELRAEWSQFVCRNVRRCSEFQQARFVHIFCSFGSEPDTILLMHEAFEQGKRVIVPVTPEQKDTELHHVEIFPGQEYKIGVFGIPVPHFSDAGEYPFCDPAIFFTHQDCIIVPLLAFDWQCQRLGYGRGFYDRFLSRTPGVRLGIGFSIQQVEEVPVDEYDIFLDAVVTENFALHSTP